MKNNIYWFACIAILFISAGCISLSPVSIDEHPIVKIDDNLVGIWKLKEDTNFHDYFVVEKGDTNTYAVTYMQRGDNRLYEHYSVFFSEINKTKFLNVKYWEPPIEGFLFLKVLAIDYNGFEIKAVALADTMLKHLTKPEEVRKRIESNINNPAFYKDTLHFRKKLPFLKDGK